MMYWLFLNLLVFSPGHLVAEAKVEDLTTFQKLSNLTFLDLTSPTYEETTGPKPIVEWLTERDHDFQHLRQEHPKTFVFRFKNVDAVPILLQTVRTSCGCTAATWTETPIAPGEMGEVVVEYDAYQRGEFKKKIRVFFDRQRKPEILWIHGEVD